MATTKVINDLIDLNQTGNTTALKGCKGDNANQPQTPTISVEYLVVGGGGGANGSGSGGGGAGGLSNGTIAVPNNTAVNIVIGQGGLGVLNKASDGLPANQGQDSGFYTIQGQGGGAGVHRGNGLPGGSGAGAGVSDTTVYSGGNGVSGQGNNGGLSSATWSAGGGGGAGAVGTNGISSQAGAGGGGTTTTIISTTNANASNSNVGEQVGSSLYFAGGGGGGGSDSLAGGNTIGGLGGQGGGGDGTGRCSDCPGKPGVANTGGGGGGSSAANADSAGGSGGSGVVILKYASTAAETITGSLAGGITTNTTADCNYPTTATALYQFSSDATDTCGNYNGTNDSGIVYTTPGKFGNGAQFGGGSDRIDIDQALLGSGTTKIWSTSFWFNTSSATEQYMNNTAAYSSGKGYSVYIRSNGYLQFSTSDGGGGNSEKGWRYEVATVNDGNWHNVVATYSSAGGTNDAYLYLYLDGVDVTSASTAINSMVNGSGPTYSSFTTPRISLGNWADSSAYPGGLAQFIGSMDQVRFFDVALTADQVAMLYAENVGATKFTENSGSDTVLVFKGGSGTINLTDTSLLGPKVGDLRTNEDQTSADSASAMEHYMSTGWRVFNNFTTLTTCDYPTTATALYQFQNTPNATCGPNPSSTQYLSYTQGVPQFKSSNKALYFKGGAGNSGVGTEWLSSTAIVDSQQNLSISLWVNFEAFGTGDQYLWSSYVTGDMWIAMRDVGSSTGYSKIMGNVYNGGSQYVLSQELVISTWYHVVLTRSTADGMVLYINGTSVDTNSNTTQPYAMSYNDSIGCYGDTSSGGTRTEFKGLIDQFRAFQSVLTPAQVTLLYNES